MARGIIGGGQIGYNWQNGAWVFGVEADFQGSGQKDSNTFSEPFTYVVPGNFVAVILGTGTVAISHEEKLDWFGTVRGRIGYAVVPDVLLYATGGLAYGHVTSSVTGTITTTSSVSATISEADTKTGWTVGAGIEGAIPNLRNWTWKLEYLYIDLGTVNYAYNSPITGSVTASNDITDNIVRAGINYRF
jgi:outer membrane immunogenic protein